MEKPTWYIVHFIDAKNLDMLEGVFAHGNVVDGHMIWVVPEWLAILRTIQPGGNAKFL